MQTGQSTLEDRFVEVFGVWKEARPYIHRMVDPWEMELVVWSQGRSTTVAEVAGHFAMTMEQATQRLERAYSRHIVDKMVESGRTVYQPTDFNARLGHFAKFENWDDIPVADRKRIDRRCLDAFIERCRPNVERKRQGLAVESSLPNDTVMLLSEVLEMIEAASAIVVQPCDCRRLGQNCDRPVEVCIWLDEGARHALDRGYGRRLTKQEAKELLRWADRKGLMHTADSEWRVRGLHDICNCCACDCYPFRAGQELRSKGVWPKSRYVAVYDPGRCSFCGACVKRCHFGAFFQGTDEVEVEGRIRSRILYDEEKCWGCGLCANTCPEEAITMKLLDGE
jgi:NAD-dependent dihydropyrimidine dehydrogenase PreA subunit